MPRYRYTCKYEHVTERIVPVAKFKEWIRCKHNMGSDKEPVVCLSRADITISNNLEVNTFKPYVEPNFCREPILIENKQQREALCDKYGTTYDSCKYVRKTPTPAAVDSIDLGHVKEAIQSGRTPDGEKIQEPVKLNKKEAKKCAIIPTGGRQSR